MGNGGGDKLKQRQEDWAGAEGDALDRELDAALAKYAAVEPRAGLEERVLANLRARGEHAPARGWWRWAVAGALAAVVVIAVALALRSGKPAQRQVTNQPPSAKPSQQARFESPNTLLTGRGDKLAQHTQNSGLKTNARHADRATVTASAPKRDQFPSPEPLSEQEKMLARYVENYPEQATLIAQARTEELQRELAEEMAETGGNQNSQ